MAKKDFYKILGVEKTATQDEIKQAYRRAASVHHPDRAGGDEVKFKEAKEAYEALSNAAQRSYHDASGSPPHDDSDMWQYDVGSAGMSIDEILMKMRMYQRGRMLPIIRVSVPIDKAFNGTELAFNVNNRPTVYQLPAGLPDQVQIIDQVFVGGDSHKIELHLSIQAGAFRFKRLGPDAHGNYSGDLELQVTVHALDLMMGGWITVQDFLGKSLQVRVPAGFDLKHRLKVAGHGYTNWRNNMENVGRGDLYLEVHPIFSTPTTNDYDKVAELYKIATETKSKL